MVAEFSEIEGPKPVLTIPKDAGSSIDQNALSVKLMAVDHQTSSEGFSISEDTQVVLSDDDSGVSAFVHHFVLYDNQARGFVRPYCMVFISTDTRKIMMFYEELSSQFKRAARFLKYGNRLLFVKDLERHLEDLEHTKGYLLNQVGRMRLKESQGPESEQSKARANAENELYKGLQNIRQSTTEIRDILTVLKPLLHDRRLESRFRVLEDRAFHRGNEELALAEKLSLQEDWFADNLYSESPTNGPVSGSLKESSVSPVSLFTVSPSHTPLLVETKKAKRFNSPLRGLHELCSWGAKEGLRKLRCIHEYFRKDAMVLEIEKNESRLMDPSNSVVIHGHCVTSNVLSGVTMRGSSLGLSEDSSSMLLSAGKMNRWSSFGSNDTLESFKSLDSYLSIRDEEETASLYSLASNNSSPGVTTSTSAQDFVSAPTSPMTEEVAFPPMAPPQTTPTTDAAPSGTSSQPTDATAHVPQSPTTQSRADIPPEFSALPWGTISVRSPPAVVSPQAQVVNNMHSPAAGPACQLNRDDAVQDRSSTIKPSNDGAIQDTGGTIKPNSDAASELDADAASAVLSAAAAPDQTLEQHCDSLSEHLHNQNLSDELKAVQGGKTDETSSTSAAAETCNSAVESKGSGVSGTAGMFPSQTAETAAGLKRLKEKDASALNSGADFSPTLNGGIAVQNPSKMAVARVPSFLPLMTLNPAQQIRAMQRQHSSHSNLSSSPEKSVDGLPGNMDRWKMESTESFRSMTDTLSQTDDGYCDMDSAADGVCNMFTATTPSSGTCMWKPRYGIFTLGDVLNSLGPGRPGHGIHEVMSTYSNLHPVLFSLMTGRTVLVVGPAKMEVEVTKVVTALSIFLPDTKRRQHCVVDWMNRPLRVTDLTRIRLAGICRSEKRSLDATIPTAVKQYSTLMDVERRVIVGPAYQGSLLHSVLHQRKSFKSDAQHVAFIHSWLMEIHNKAFIFYHSFCLGEAGGLTHHSVEKHREQYNATICCLMNRLGVRDHDVTIVEYLAEKVKLSQLEPLIWTGVDKGSVVHPLTISSRGNHTFRC